MLAEKTVVFYPAFGYRKDQQWIIPLRYWVKQDPDRLRRLVARGACKVVRKAAGLEQLTAQQKALFTVRTSDFVADSESGEGVLFAFDNDPESVQYRVVNVDGRSKTDFNGLLSAELVISQQRARVLLAAQNSAYGWLSFHSVSDNHVGTGQLRLIEPVGTSVISDIDDTIKVTDIPAGESTVLKNTFFRDFEAVPCMVDSYAQFEPNVAFHYVSGAPWQLFTPLSNFLFAVGGAGFPPGSVQMKSVRTNLFEADSYRDIWKLIANGSKQVTIAQKLLQIEVLLNAYPARKFILIGDSGERDPEIFSQIRNSHTDQILEIRIRDVVNAAQLQPQRLRGMNVIPSTGNGSAESIGCAAPDP